MNRALKQRFDGTPQASSLSFRSEDDFYSEANALRQQLEDSFSPRDQAGITPLTYVFSENRYQFLTANAENVFTAESLRRFVEFLESWGQAELNTSHVSTPQVRVFIRECGRSILQDAVTLGWHYILSLTRSNSRIADRVRVVIPERGERRNRLVGACDLVGCEFKFNRLIVHDTQNAYGIDPCQSSMNPLTGTIFLDGYLW